MKNMFRACRLRLGGFAAACGWIVLVVLPAPVPAQQVVARTYDVRGNVWATQADGRLRRLADESELFVDNKVVTARKSTATIRFGDQTELNLAEQTIINIDQYIVAGSADEAAANAHDESMQTSFLRGIVRSVSGLLAKRRPRSVRFTTPSATIGVRGTHFLTEVEGEQVTVVLLEQETDPTAANAVEVSNEQGSVEIDQANFGTVVANANTPPTPPERMRTAAMNRLLRSVQAARRVSVPRVPLR